MKRFDFKLRVTITIMFSMDYKTTLITCGFEIEFACYGFLRGPQLGNTVKTMGNGEFCVYSTCLFFFTS